jgi:hypothetical protein
MPKDKVSGGPTIPHYVLINITREAFVEQGRELAYRVASHIAGEVRDTILRQTQSDWPPLSPNYARHKALHGLDPRMLIATGAYVHSIVPRRNGPNSYTVAPSEEPLTDSKGRPTGYTLTDLGAWLEFGTLNPDGTQKMPPRPHWRPVLDDYSHDQTEVEKEMQTRISESIRGTLQNRRAKARRTHTPHAPHPSKRRRHR